MVETLRMALYIQIVCLSTLNLINQRNVSHIKLSKYCDIDTRLVLKKIMCPVLCHSKYVRVQLSEFSLYVIFYSEHFSSSMSNSHHSSYGHYISLVYIVC